MNYGKNYHDYIGYVKTLDRSKKGSIYYEEHHIIPRCCGGSNDLSNLVLLTGREHFLAHYLLAKIYENTPYKYKLSYAFIGMKRQRSYQSRYLNSRLYEAYKKKYAEISSENNKGQVPWNKGKTGIYSEETLKKIGDASSKKIASPTTRQKMSLVRKGKKKRPLSVAHKEKLSKSSSGKIFVTHPETKEIHQIKFEEIDEYLNQGYVKGCGDRKGKKVSEETKLKISSAIKGRPRSEKAKENISKGKKGHMVSLETREKIRQSLLKKDYS